jgi:hypothetical protein
MPEFIAIIPDKPGAYAKRMEIRPKHLVSAKSNFENGPVTMGGGYADEFPAEGQPPQLKGSIMTMEANSKEEVLEFLKKDIYYSEGVWDLENVQIYAVSHTYLLIL